MTAATITTGTGLETLRPGVWQIDPERAVVAFSGKASFVAPTITARFLGITGAVAVGDDATTGQVEVAVDVSTMTTGNRTWDEMIAAFDPFDARQSPVATYRSSAVRWNGDEAEIDGELTLRGVSRRVPLTAGYAVGRHGDRMLIRAAGSIDRSDFGVRFDVPGCGKLIPKRMRLEIDVDAVYLG